MRFTLIACSLIILISCNQSRVELEKTNAKGEVPLLGNLTFQFSSPLAPDSLLNNWDSTGYINFTPAIPGKFRWEQPDILVFSPARPLAPATAYTARLDRKLLAYSKFGKVGNGEDLQFATPGLSLEDAEIRWVLAQGSGKANAQADLYFNYNIALAGLKQHLKLTLDGKEISYTAQTQSASNRVSLLLRDIKQIDKNLEGRIVLTKGLIPEGGSKATTEDIEMKAQLTSPYNLVVNEVTGSHDGSYGTVMINTSQPVDLSDLSSQIKITPTVKFTVDATDEGFSIKSENFNPDKSYLVTLSKGIRGLIGGRLQVQYDNNVAFGELEPSLKFVSNKNLYLSARGKRLIEMKIVNTPRFKVVISKVYESNLLASQAYGYYPQEKNPTGDDDIYSSGDYGDYTPDYTVGDVIYEDVIDTRSLPQLGNSRLFTFNIEERLPDLKGIYHIKIRSLTSYWKEDSRFISVSDIGLIAKEARDKVLVFANSIKTAEPLPAVNMIAYGSNSQVLGMAATNEQGVAEIKYSRKEFAGFKPAMIVAKTEGDFNFLSFKNTKVNTSRFEVGGKRTNTTGLDAFIYGERDIYRPGERINFSVIVRNARWQSPGELPVKFRFLYPNGKEYRVFRKTLNSEGSAEGNIDLAVSAITGTYSLEVYTSNDVLMGTYGFSVEEFVPDRIKVSASLSKPFLEPAQPVTLSLNAVNFFGPPAADRKYETEIQVRSKYFVPKKYKAYDFAIQNEGLALDKIVREGKTDAQGNATEKYEVPAMFKNNGILQATFYNTVFDETGRPVSKGVSADVYTQAVFNGIGDDGAWYYPLNQPISFPLIALDKDERPMSGVKAQVKMIRHEYRTVLAKSGSYFRYESQEQDKLLAEQEITVNGENMRYAFVPRAPGNYEIRIFIPGAAAYVSKKFYSYGSWGGDNNSFEVDPDGSIDIESDKSVYSAGTNAKLLFKCPFDGKMLVTMETDKIVSYQYVDVQKRNASIDVPITSDHLPNVFVTATLFKPHGISEIPLTVAHGYQNIKVEEKSRINKIELLAAGSTRSLQDQGVSVTAEPGSFVTLAAVDNGVLQVSDFKTPDPYNYFYGQRALEVDAYDLYPYLFPELRARLSSTGGDGEAEMSKRVNPMPSKRIQLLSYWSGITKTDGNGKAKFQIHIPKFSGQVRLMAVAYKNDHFGSAEAVMTVADPVVLSTALPRFLSPGDTMSVPVTVTNTTAKNAEANGSLTTSGPLKVLGEPEQKFALTPNSEKRVEFRLVANSGIDTGRIVTAVNVFGERFKEEIPIAVRPASSLQVMTGNGALTAGKQSLTIPTSDFIPGSADYKLVISQSSLLEAGRQLQYLVQYPYGCTEQVVSAAFPQLYFGELADQLSPKENLQSAYSVNVNEAIRKIKLAQLYNGAVTLWDGAGSENWWCSIYAAHFLLEAKKAGYEVDESLLNGLLNYINSRLGRKQTITYYFNRDQKKKIAPKEVAYSLYVLALANRSNVPVMNYYKANPELLSLDNKYLLSVAFAISGDKKKYNDFLPASFAGEVSVKQTGGSFYSGLRDEAIALNALMDIDPGNVQVPIMVRHVTEQMRTNNYLNTQECAFGLLALGKFARHTGPSNLKGAVNSNGKTVARFSGKDLRLSAKQLTSNQINFDLQGQGKLYYYWESEGISASGKYNEEDHYIKVRRQFFDRYGNQKTGTTFKQNELIIVRVTLEKVFNGDIDNIAITDLLPAGFEIENPRTKEIPGMEWIKNAATPDALDVRDDRINIFTDLNSDKKVFYYAVRAVSPGIFKQGPINADAMYNREYHSYHGAQSITVQR